MKKIEVMGVSLGDLTLRESMNQVGEFLTDGKVSTIGLITMQGLIGAQDDEEARAWMNGLDMTVCTDPDILKAAGITQWARIHDVERQAFWEEFLRKLRRQNKSVYLLSGTQAGLEELTAQVAETSPKLEIAGRMALDSVEQGDDFVINDINLKTPDVLISNLDSPLREEFLKEHQKKLNVAIWLMMRADQMAMGKKETPAGRAYHRLLKWLFRIRLFRYNKDHE